MDVPPKTYGVPMKRMALRVRFIAIDEVRLMIPRARRCMLSPFAAASAFGAAAGAASSTTSGGADHMRASALASGPGSADVRTAPSAKTVAVFGAGGAVVSAFATPVMLIVRNSANKAVRYGRDKCSSFDAYEVS
ncbi:MAG: hypothetical protein NVSMB21_16930 [Vulcanimicrobiaceae bacterium]